MRVLALILLSAFPGFLFADSIVDPYPWSEESPSGEYVFVMLPEGNMWRDGWAPGDHLDEMNEVYSSYSMSGLYRNDGSTEPLWTFEGYLYSAYIMDDGRHMVVPAAWATDMQSRAVAFYRDGELLRYWSVGELVHFRYIHPHSVSHFMWQEDRRWDAWDAEYTILTMEGFRYTFDATTGEMKSSEFQWNSRSLLLRWGVGLLAVLTTVLGTVWLIRRFRRLSVDASTESDTLDI
jgi:hypothetical protein